MDVAPLTMNDPWAHRAQNDPKVNAQMLRGVPSEIAVDMSSIEIYHHGPELNYRPYLHLAGGIDEVTPGVMLPFGVKRLPFKEGSSPAFDAFYEFTDAQLADLVEKGYFTEDFKVPEELEQAVWDLPAKADFLVVAPEHSTDVPLIFVGVHDSREMTMTEASSEYDLHNFFPNYIADKELGAEEVIQRREAEEAKTRSDEIKDLFADVEFEEPVDRSRTSRDDIFEMDEAEAPGTPGVQPQVPQDVFGKLIGEARARQVALFGEAPEAQTAEEQAETVAEEVPEFTQDDAEESVRVPRRPSVSELYRSKIAPSIAASLEADVEDSLLSGSLSPDKDKSVEVEAETADDEPVAHPEAETDDLGLDDEFGTEDEDASETDRKRRAAARRSAEDAAAKREEAEKTEDGDLDFDLD